MSWKVWRWYLVALVATVLACCLWLVVFSELRDSSSLPREGSRVVAPQVLASPGRLPVVPVLRPAVVSSVSGG